MPQLYPRVQVMEMAPPGFADPLTVTLTRNSGSSNMTYFGLGGLDGLGSIPHPTSIVAYIARIYNNQEYAIYATPGTISTVAGSFAFKAVYNVPANTDRLRVYFGDNATNAGWNPQSATAFDDIGWARYIDITTPFGDDESGIGAGLRSTTVDSLTDGSPLTGATPNNVYVVSPRVGRTIVPQPSAFPSEIV